ncbi:unnamed protein product [Ectocarpus sp. CCAP 1310/34]|nr:unnamed protein product [Ectocarpus sp. CCAP 1310/34]
MGRQPDVQKQRQQQIEIKGGKPGATRSGK